LNRTNLLIIDQTDEPLLIQLTN